MGKPINTNFDVYARVPIDSRYSVGTLTDLDDITYPYEGLITLVLDTSLTYRYMEGIWAEFNMAGGIWGNITGDITTQTDLMDQLFLKFDKTGGTISGAVTVLAEVEATNFISTDLGGDYRSSIKSPIVTALDYELNLALGNMFKVPLLAGDATITLLNEPVTGLTQNFKVVAELGGNSLTLPSHWKPLSGSIPLSGTLVNVIDVTYTNTTVGSEEAVYNNQTYTS